MKVSKVMISVNSTAALLFDIVEKAKRIYMRKKAMI
jgi:hypothetical protein